MSFTRAADELCVTIPALSHHIKAIEEDLRKPVFVRHHRSIELTEAGQALYDATRSAFGGLHRGWRGLAAGAEAVRMTTGISLMANWLSHRLDGLQKAIGEHSVEHIGTFDQTLVDKGQAEISIRHSDVRDIGVFSEDLFVDWWTPMVTPELAENLRSPEDLLNFQIIEAAHDDEPRTQPRIRDWFEAMDLDLTESQMHRFSHTEPAMKMVTDGLGVKLCQNLLSYESLETGALVIPFPIAIRRAGFRYRFVCASGEEDSQPIAAIRSFLKQEMAKASTLSEQVQILEMPRIQN